MFVGKGEGGEAIPTPTLSPPNHFHHPQGEWGGWGEGSCRLVVPFTYIFNVRCVVCFIFLFS